MDEAGTAKLIENIVPGDYVLSRDENDPYGPLQQKLVEEKFVRTGLIWHLTANGKLIKTTGEHPYFTERTWSFIPTSELRVGDRFLNHMGTWVTCEEVYQTGKYETVYNLRVADYHTYFVGSKAWGWSVWAHNTYTERTQAQAEDELFNIMMVGQDPSNTNAIRQSARQLAVWGARDGFAGDAWLDTIVNHPQKTPLALLMGDSNPDFLLSIANAEAALIGPPGSTLRVKGAGGGGADLVFEAEGAVVFGREVKSVPGEWRSIEGHFSKAKTQIGSDVSGDIYFQMPNATTHEEAAGIARRLAGLRKAPEKKAPYANKTFTIVNEDGQILYHGPAVP